MMETALIQFLLAQPGLAVIVGPRINWSARPQADSLPAVVLFKMPGSGRDKHMKGRSGLVESRVQIDCWGKTYLSAKAVADQVLLASDALPGLRSGIDFQGVFPEGDRDDYEGDLPSRLYRTSFDLRIWHSED